MSINVYLKDGVEQLEGFQTKKRKSKDGQQWNEYYLPGLKVSRDKGRWYFYLYELTDPIAPVVKDLVDEISFYDRIPRRPERAIGIYKHEDAEAELDRSGEAVSYGLRIRGKSMKNMLELYRRIRAGKITPRESWDAEQEMSQTPETPVPDAAADEISTS